MLSKLIPAGNQQNQHPAAAADQQGLTLSLASPKPTVFTGETVSASEITEPGDLIPSPVAESPTHGNVHRGSWCNSCYRHHRDFASRCTSRKARQPSSKEWLVRRYFPLLRSGDEASLQRGQHLLSSGELSPTFKFRNGQDVNASSAASRRPFSWWHFPAEVRTMIYDYTLHWPDSYTLYHGYNKQLHAYRRDKNLGNNGPLPRFSGRMKTPTIILLCKMITNECIHNLHSRPFIIDQIPPWLPSTRRPMSIMNFISKETLQHIRHIDIRIAVGEGIGSGWVWRDILQDIFDALRGENHFVDMRIMLKLCNMDNHNLWGWEECGEYMKIKAMISSFKKAAPNVWKPGQVTAEEWVVEGRLARKVPAHYPELVKFNTRRLRELRELLYDIKAKDEVHEWPNSDIWPGSVLDFVRPLDPIQSSIADDECI